MLARGRPAALALLALSLLLALAAWRMASTHAPAILPPGVTGVLTYQRAGNVYTLPLDTQTERKLTDYPSATAAEYSARSPDGARLAVVRLDAAGRTLAVLSADRSSSRVILHESSGYTKIERPQWTADGGSIVYTLRQFLVEGGSIKGETLRAEQINPDGSNRRVIAPNVQDATLAADGTLAFVRPSSTGDQLVLRAPDGTEPVLVPEGSFSSLAAPRFSPDGQRIAFAAVGDGPPVGGSPLAPSRAGSPLAFHRLGPPLAAPSAGPPLAPPKVGGGWGGPILPGLRLGPASAYAHGLPWDIWLAEVGGGVRRVNRLAEDEPSVAWDRGGQYLAVSGGTGVYIVDAASGRATQLAKTGGFGGIDWTP